MRLMRDRVEDLRIERDSLSANLLALQNVEEENLRLRSLMQLSQRVEIQFKAANLYPARRSGEIVARSFRLDIGREDDVAADAAVVAPEGLVGVVRATSAGQALGDYWTHPDFRVSAMTTDGSVFGIISPSESSLLMELGGAPYQVQLAPGTELVTSGMGGVFPRGIPVGTVIEVRGEQAGWTKSYRVRPSVYPESVREVMVLVLREPVTENEDDWQGPASEEER